MGEAFEKIHVELDRYDGPWSGLADVDGIIHYFKHVTIAPDVQQGEYQVWPASPEAIALEREQWAIYIAWLTRYAEGSASSDAHPGHGGINERYDELQVLLAPQRIPPTSARRMFGEHRIGDREERYTLDGTNDEIRFYTPGDRRSPEGHSKLATEE